MKKLLLLFCVLLSAVGAKAVTVTVYDENGVEYWLTDFSQGSCVSGLLNPSNTTSVTVKSSVSYEGVSYPIVRVGVGAFSGNTQLQSITLPSSITMIGTNAFNGCTGLKTVSFAANSQLATIESSAFLGCTSLTTFNLSGLSQLTEIDYNAFYGCTSLRSVQLPAQITKINAGVFSRCSSLNSINWSNLTALTEIGYSAFSGTAFTALDFSAMTALTEIGHDAFSNCTNLARVTLPTQTTKINSGTFSGCSSLNSLNWSSLTSLTEIGSSAFKGTAFSSMSSLPTTLTTVGDYAFQDCTNLTTATLPASVTAFPTGLFKGCTALESITMNMRASTSIAPSMFEGCTSLTTIKANGSSTVKYKAIGEKAFSKCTGLSNTLIYDLLLFSAGIGAYAFEGCTGLTGTTGLASSHTTEIGEGAFSGCWNLTSFTAPNNLQSIGDYAFEGCGSLTSATFGRSLRSVGQDAFAETPITSVSLPGTVTEIADGAFSDCSHLTSLTIGNDNDSDETLTIGMNAFCGTKITTLDLPDRVVSIGENAFGSCFQLATVNISDHSQLESIDSWAFYGTAIKKITIPTFVNSVADDAFLNSPLRLILNHSRYLLSGELGYGHVVVIDQPQDSWCDTQTGDWYYDAAHTKIAYIEDAGASYTIRNGVTSIGKNAFYGQTSLYSLTIPASVTSIGSYAFADCSRLTSVILDNSNPDNISLGGGEFSGIASDAKLSVPLGSSRLYKARRAWTSQFSVIRLIDDALTLAEGQPYTLAYGEDNVRVTYNRRFNTNKWQALYIPFEMTSAEWSQFGEVAEISGVHQYDGNDGEVTVIEFRKLKSGESVMPNTPYVFRVDETWTGVELPLVERSLKELAPAESNSVWCASTRNTYTLTGVYESTNINGSYAIGGGEFHLADAQSPELAPYRFYLSISKDDHGYGNGSQLSQNAPARIRIMVDGEETGIDEIATSQSSDGQSVFDLQGRRVLAPQKGRLYIVNGKKLLF